MVTEFLINHQQVTKAEPMFVGQTIDVAVDPSKAHSGVVIATADDSRKVAIECLAGGGNVDVFEACAEIHEFFATLLHGSIIRLAGVEDPITKSYDVVNKQGKRVRVNPGMETHENRLKLSAIFTTYMNVLRLMAHHEIMRVNNEAWKKAILPPEFRKREVGKGSNLWLPTIEPGYTGYDDNITDAGCILLYLRQATKAEKVICKRKVEAVELSLCQYSFAVYDYADYHRPVYVYNTMLSFKDNVVYVANRSQGDVSVLELSVHDLPVDILYTDKFRAKKFDSDTFMVLIGGET